MNPPLERLTAALADRYSLLRQLGAGGMATVYLARDLKHDRDVAIKVLKPELGAALGAERFLAEIKVTANLRHPNVLPLFDSGSADGQLFYVMPYIDGETLRARMQREQQLPTDEVLRIAGLLAAALDYAHANAVVHRDLKPENILLQAGQPIIADFGIALAIEHVGGDRVTQTGLSLGTPNYMSPEQAAGDRAVDARSDQFALGAMTYEMLVGEPPHSGVNAQIIIARLMTETPRSVRTARPGVTSAIDAAVLRALSKSPADRFASCSEFARALSDNVTDKSSKQPTRARRSAMCVGALVTVAIVGAILVKQFSHHGVIRRVAVLPLTSGRTSADSGLAADGVTRSIIEALTDAGVPVVGYRTVMRYQNSLASIKDIAHALDVDAVIVGSVTQSAGTLDVSLEMTDPVTNENRYAHTFSRPSAEVLILQQEAAFAIATAMKTPLAADRAAKLSTARHVNPDAYALYLLGERLNQRYTADASLQADGVLRKSIELDSTFAPAYAELSNAIFYRAWFLGDPDTLAKNESRKLLARAYLLDPKSPEVLVARGAYRAAVEWDFKGAESDFRNAMALRPDAYTIDIYSWFLGITFRSEEALVHARKAVALEPKVSPYRNDYVLALMGGNDLNAAEIAADSAIKIDPGYAANYVPGAWIALTRGRVTEAESRMRRYVQLTNTQPEYWPALVLAHTGDVAEARRTISAVEQARAARALPRRSSTFAAVYLAMGDTTTAVSIVNDALKHRDATLLKTFYFPTMREFARSPRMKAVRTQMGLPN